MNGFNVKEVLSNFDEIFSLISELETIIGITKHICIHNEVSQTYNCLSTENQLFISKERNDNVNMLTIALEKLENLKSLSSNVENEFLYNNTPTIAADK